MAQLMLVNPRKRKAKKAAPKAKRRAVAKKAHRKYRRNPIALKSTARKYRRKYRRNPIGMKGFFSPLMPAAVSAGGALALDIGWGFIASKLPLPLQSGPTGLAAKAVGALALGSLAGMVGVKKDTANQIAVGALTVVLHAAAKGAVAKAMPTLNLGGDDDSEIDGLAEYFTGDMGEYLPDNSGVGYASAGQSFDPNEMGAVGVDMPFTL